MKAIASLLIAVFAISMAAEAKPAPRKTVKKAQVKKAHRKPVKRSKEWRQTKSEIDLAIADMREGAKDEETAGSEPPIDISELEIP